MASTTRQTNPSRRVPASKTRSTGEAVEPDAAPSQYSGVKQIIACVDGTEADRTVLDHALAVALRFGSHIDVLHVRFDVHGVSVGAGRERYGDRLLDVPVEHAVADAAARARRHFEAWQARCKLPARDTGVAMRGPSASWREILGYESDVIARLGRLSDLIVIARPGERSSSSSLMALETALFDTGRPVLMVPDRTEAANLFRRPLIAWNGSLEAARAVGFALPFLCECEGGADVFVAPEQKHRTDTEELLRYLGWHGIVAERMSVESSGPIGMSLLAQASTNRAGFIVMGAYTHGHYRQFFFGGVTRYVMEHAAVPVLLAH